MKLILIITMLLAVCLWQGCSPQPQQSPDTEINVLIDRTDKSTNYPTSQAILKALDLQRNKWQGIRITLTFISDLDVNEHRVIDLPKQREWDGNIVERGTQIRQFTRQLQQALDTMRNAPPCNHSIIYRAIAREATILAKASAEKKYLLVYSNLYENNGDLNAYHPAFFQELQQRPDKIRAKLVKSMPPGNIFHVQVWLLYNPTSFEDNNHYMAIAGFYQHLFEVSGATVHISNQFSLL